MVNAERNKTENERVLNMKIAGVIGTKKNI